MPALIEVVIGVAMKQGDRVIGLISLMFSFWLIYGSADLKYMTEYKPGPGFLPFWIGVIFGLLGILLMVDTFIRKGNQEDLKKQLPGIKSLSRVGLVLIILAGFAILMMILGFILTTFIFVFSILFALERYNGLQSGLWALLFSGFVYLIFISLMRLDLPKGFVGF